MVKASNTANANYALTPSFYAQTNAIYRFYTYQLVIDDAPTIAYGQYWPLQNLTSTNLSMGSSCRRTFNGQKKVPKIWPIFSLSCFSPALCGLGEELIRYFIPKHNINHKPHKINILR